MMFPNCPFLYCQYIRDEKKYKLKETKETEDGLSPVFQMHSNIFHINLSIPTSRTVQSIPASNP